MAVADVERCNCQPVELPVDHSPTDRRWDLPAQLQRILRQPTYSSGCGPDRRPLGRRQSIHPAANDRQHRQPRRCLELVACSSSMDAISRANGGGHRVNLLPAKGEGPAWNTIGGATSLGCYLESIFLNPSASFLQNNLDQIPLEVLCNHGYAS